MHKNMEILQGSVDNICNCLACWQDFVANYFFGHAETRRIAISDKARVRHPIPPLATAKLN